MPQARLGLVEATDRAQDMVATNHSPRSAGKNMRPGKLSNVLGEFGREKNKLVQV